jgi:hypothetical protein
MQATELLGRELKGIKALVHDLADEVTEREWVTPTAPGTNPLGFNMWHAARAQDWILRSMILDQPEVIQEDRFRALAWSAAHGIGCGMSKAEIAELVRRCDRDSVLAYADAINDELRGWLRTISDDDLDAVPPFEARQNAIAAYCTPAHWKETAHLVDLPIWRLVAGPGRAHARDHVAEAEVLLQLLRAQPG